MIISVKRACDFKTYQRRRQPSSKFSTSKTMASLVLFILVTILCILAPVLSSSSTSSLYLPKTFNPSNDDKERAHERSQDLISQLSRSQLGYNMARTPADPTSASDHQNDYSEEGDYGIHKTHSYQEKER